MTHRWFVPVAVLAVAAVACGGTITLPELPTAGPTIVEDVSIPVPAAGPARLTISFGAGELKLARAHPSLWRARSPTILRT